MNIIDENVSLFPLMEDQPHNDDKLAELTDTLPLLALKNIVMLPGVIKPISIGRPKSLNLVREAYSKKMLIGTITQKSVYVEDPNEDDLYKIGTICRIVKVIDLPDGSTTALIKGMERFKMKGIVDVNPYYIVNISKFSEKSIPKTDKQFEAIVSSIKDISIRIIEMNNKVPEEILIGIKNFKNNRFLINFIASNLDIDIIDQQKLLEITDLKKRAQDLLQLLNQQVQLAEIKNSIQGKVKSDIDRQQREFLMQQQIKTLQKELGNNPMDKEYEELKKKATTKKWSEQISAHFNKELEKLKMMNPAVPEYSVQLNYLHTLIDLPWDDFTKDNLNLKNAEKVLNRDHYSLENVKERILEYLAVLKLKGNLKSPILCLYGPPGVGKTSLGKSIATALERNYVRISLGGLHDEAEIRGHRKTYIGAMPGRIVQNLKKAKSSNPVFVLDEIDKVGTDFRGDPASALLEVLDPEQNNAFYDNYLELEYDLSNVLFIATANTTATISPALRDRMEMIEVNGYTTEEKIEIAILHLIPKQMDAHGLDLKKLKFSKSILQLIITDYTRESGVRTLDKTLAKLIRKYAKREAYGEKYTAEISAADVRDALGPQSFFSDTYEGNEFVGVVVGLAWTAVGGSILYIETSLSRGKGGVLTLTGNLGSVMKESATIALEYLKSHASEWDIDTKIFEHWNIHLHVPEGAIPKDGPSAGITMLTAIASTLTQRKIKPHLAMTGEITLRGKVLPVGGIKEKILAAKRAHIKEIIISKENKVNVEEMKDEYTKGLKFHYVETINEVLAIALLKTKVKNPINFVNQIDKSE